MTEPETTSDIEAAFEMVDASLAWRSDDPKFPSGAQAALSRIQSELNRREAQVEQCVKVDNIKNIELARLRKIEKAAREHFIRPLDADLMLALGNALQPPQTEKAHTGGGLHQPGVELDSSKGM